MLYHLLFIYKITFKIWELTHGGLTVQNVSTKKHSLAAWQCLMYKNKINMQPNFGLRLSSLWIHMERIKSLSSVTGTAKESLRKFGRLLPVGLLMDQDMVPGLHSTTNPKLVTLFPLKVIWIPKLLKIQNVET